MARVAPLHDQAHTRHHIARAMAVGKHMGLNAASRRRARHCPEAGAAIIGGMAEAVHPLDAWLNDAVGRPTMRDLGHAW